MFPIKSEDALNLKADDLEKLAELDANGLLIAPGESLEQFKQRLAYMSKNYQEFDDEIDKEGEITIFESVKLKKESRIPPEILEEAAELNRDYYDFSIDWVPGFFLTESMGFLWGGCAISSPETLMSIFLIRKSFHTKKKWYLYYRSELLAHELCHIARTPVGDMKFEEYFAYQLSPSWLRRTFGSCFQTGFDALFFISPILLLVFATMLQTFTPINFPLWPFWLSITVAPTFLITRNFFMRKMVLKATKNLKNAGYNSTGSILFRCHRSEIAFFAKSSTQDIIEFINARTATELRWKIIQYRFINKPKED